MPYNFWLAWNKLGLFYTLARLLVLVVTSTLYHPMIKIKTTAIQVFISSPKDQLTIINLVLQKIVTALSNCTTLQASTPVCALR